MSAPTEAEMTQAQREHLFTTAVLGARDQLKPIVEGLIERGHCVGGTEACGARRGKRKTMLKDAKRLAERAITMIDRAVNEFEDSDPETGRFRKG